MHKQSSFDAVTQPVLSIQNLTKSFDRLAAVSDMNLAILPGEIVGFLGPNGAGKTTTIKLILDILRPTRGKIELFGQSSRNTVDTHRRIGYLSGDMTLDDDLTGLQYLTFVGNAYGSKYQERMLELAERLQANLTIKIGAYSRGNKQKIGLIASLMHQPDLLILDEPSSGFDPLMQELFIRLIEEYRSAGGTVFISSHTLAEVQRLCDRVAFIKDGSLIGVTSVNDLGQAGIKRIRVAGDHRLIQKITLDVKSLPGLTVTESLPTRLGLSYNGAMQSLLVFFAAYDLDDCTIQEPELEEIFMGYYQNTKETAV